MQNNFNKNIKFLRENKYKLSQNKFAELVGVNQTTIKRWEDEQRTPTIDSAIDISNKLNIPLNILVGEDASIIDNLELDKNHVIDKLIIDKSKELSNEDKIMLSNMMDNIIERNKKE